MEPYERTLNRMPVAERKRWAERVKKQIDNDILAADEIIILAGQRYRENLMGHLKQRFAKVTIPMEGLTSGRQLSWLDHATSL